MKYRTYRCFDGSTAFIYSWERYNTRINRNIRYRLFVSKGKILKLEERSVRKLLSSR